MSAMATPSFAAPVVVEAFLGIALFYRRNNGVQERLVYQISSIQMLSDHWGFDLHVNHVSQLLPFTCCARPEASQIGFLTMSV